MFTVGVASDLFNMSYTGTYYSTDNCDTGYTVALKFMCQQWSTSMQCSGSVTLWYGSGSWDLYLWALT